MRKISMVVLIALLIVVAGCTTNKEDTDMNKINEISKDGLMEIPKNAQKATFAGGCFWCVEAAFEDMDGVISAVSGYTGGEEKTADYSSVSSGTTEHFEAVEVLFDPEVVSYKELLDAFWKSIDPTDDGGQFADRGPQYRTAIFYHSEEQKKVAEESKKEMQQHYEDPIVTEVLPAQDFYDAEEYHQDYAKKRVAQYLLYKKGSGREGYINDKWG